MSEPPSSNKNKPESGYERLESQINWYDRKSVSNQRFFKRLKLVELVAAACVPLAAPYHSIVTAALGAIVVILAGIQHLNQYQQNWIAYRTTCEALRHEKFLFLARAGHYDNMDEDAAMKSLVCRVESLVSTEHAKWLLAQDETQKKMKDKGS